MYIQASLDILTCVKSKQDGPGSKLIIHRVLRRLMVWTHQVVNERKVTVFRAMSRQPLQNECLEATTEANCKLYQSTTVLITV